jgi:hypothetical protein
MLVTIHSAAEMLGLSDQTLRFRVLHSKHLRLARRRPVMKLRLADVLVYRETMPPLDHRGQGRPRLDANRILEAIK